MKTALLLCNSDVIYSPFLYKNVHDYLHKKGYYCVYSQEFFKAKNDLLIFDFVLKAEIIIFTDAAKIGKKSKEVFDFCVKLKKEMYSHNAFDLLKFNEKERKTLWKYV